MKSQSIARQVAPLLACAVLAGCASAPFKQPPLDLPAAWQTATPLGTASGKNANAGANTSINTSAAAGTSTGNGAAAVQTAADGTHWKAGQSNAAAQPKGEWWRVFNDAQLNQLIEQANQANPGLAQAAARVRQARALAGFKQAAQMPQVNAGLGATRSRASSDGYPAGSSAAVLNSYQANLGVSYEVDLFGRLSGEANAAKLDAAASEANYRAVLLALQADIAQNWFNLRATDAELATLQQTTQLREESVHVNQRRYDLGEIGEFDLVRARTELSTARAEFIGLQRQRVGYEHALAILQGKAPAQFSQASLPLAQDSNVPVIPAGMPSSLLERRPDIAAAQRGMEASWARIGAARAAMFPVLNLNFSGGGAAGTLSNVLNWSSRSWVLGALASVPLLDGGRNQANIAGSEAVLEQAVAGYRQNVLVAFAEVEDNLAGLRILADQATQIDDAVLSARRALELAQSLYGAGRSSYLDLLDAQRNLASAQRSAVQVRGRRAVGTVALIRALGGGWEGSSIQ